MSAYEVTPDWKSPRKIEIELRDYLRKRFEDYMVAQERGEYPTQALAILALRQELNYESEA